jgi:hypothetical protein
MSEMDLTNEHLVVIGRGRLIAEMAVSDFIAQSSRQFVRVRTRQCELLTRELQATGASVGAPVIVEAIREWASRDDFQRTDCRRPQSR